MTGASSFPENHDELGLGCCIAPRLPGSTPTLPRCSRLRFGKHARRTVIVIQTTVQPSRSASSQQPAARSPQPPALSASLSHGRPLRRHPCLSLSLTLSQSRQSALRRSHGIIIQVVWLTTG